MKAWPAFDGRSRRAAGPRLDLANADLVRSHVHAVWLAEALAGTQEGLGRSPAQVLDLTGPGLPVAADLRQTLADPDAAARALATAGRLLDPMAGELAQSSWWHEQWPQEVIAAAAASFDGACQRWRDLYALAAAEKEAAHAVNSDPTASPKERDDARCRYGEASRRLELLLNESDAFGQSDFYTYRYLASEGFLPGYSFPRLPLAAYIPGTRGKDGDLAQKVAGTPLHPGHPGEGLQLAAARPVPGDPRVRPRCADLPRGRPLPGHPDRAAQGRGGRHSRRGDPQRGEGVHRLRLSPSPPGRAGRVRVLRRSVDGGAAVDAAAAAGRHPTAPPDQRGRGGAQPGSDTSCAPLTGSPRGRAPMVRPPGGWTRPSSARTAIRWPRSPTVMPPRSAWSTWAGAVGPTRTSWASTWT